MVAAPSIPQRFATASGMCAANGSRGKLPGTVPGMSPQQKPHRPVSIAGFGSTMGQVKLMLFLVCER